MNSLLTLPKYYLDKAWNILSFDFFSSGVFFLFPAIVLFFGRFELFSLVVWLVLQIQWIFILFLLKETRKRGFGYGR